MTTAKMTKTSKTNINSSSYENPWLFNNEPFDSDSINNFFGFVYLITNLTNSRMYIGRKYFWSIKRDPGKIRRRKRESDWKKYYGSSDELAEDIKNIGNSNFKREILALYTTKGSTNYGEVKEQFVKGVLESNVYYNTSINGKWRNVKLDGAMFKQE